MFQSQMRFPVTMSFDHDPAADDTLPVWRAPFAAEVKTAYVTTANDVAASTANYFDLALLNGGAAGTATTEIGGTIGGTAGWTGLTPKAFTLSSATVSAGDVVTLKYNEEGTGTFGQMTVQLDVVYGT